MVALHGVQRLAHLRGAASHPQAAVVVRGGVGVAHGGDRFRGERGDVAPPGGAEVELVDVGEQGGLGGVAEQQDGAVLAVDQRERVHVPVARH